MIQERAILHFNKFKALKNQYVLDSIKGTTLQVIKIKLTKLSDDDYEVKITVKSDLDNGIFDIDSEYANNFIKEI